MKTVTQQKNNDKEITMLEQKLDKALAQIQLLSKKVLFLERENNRRKSEINQLANAIKRL